MKLEPNEVKLEPSELKLDTFEISTDVPKQEDAVEGTNGVDEVSEKPINGSDLPLKAPELETDVVFGDGNPLDEKPVETTNADMLSDTEKRKKEIRERIEVLTAKKHEYVQVLKQILNAEEELKSQNSTQDTGTHPSIPLHVDVTNDLGSLSRLSTPRLNSDGNLASDIEKGEADENSPHNTQSCHLVQTNSDPLRKRPAFSTGEADENSPHDTQSGHMARTTTISPSPDSLHKRPAFSTGPHPRGSLGGVGSPSRFAPVGPPTNVSTTVSTSGTGYIASSPSPAASGGTSAFRDNNQQPSPWN